MVSVRSGCRVLPRRACGRGSSGAPRVAPVGGRAGFTLVEALIAVVLLGVGAAAAASGQAWAARTLERAEQREEAAATAELVLDSLAQLAAVTGGRLDGPHGLHVDWTAEAGRRGTTVRLRVRSTRSGMTVEEAFDVFLAPPPMILGATP